MSYPARAGYQKPQLYFTKVVVSRGTPGRGNGLPRLGGVTETFILFHKSDGFEGVMGYPAPGAFARLPRLLPIF